MKNKLIFLILIIFPVSFLFGVQLDFKSSPSSQKIFVRKKNGYISLFSISLQMGAELHWDRQLGKIELCRANKKVSFFVNSRLFFYQKSKVKTLLRPSVVKKGEILVPVDSMRVIYRELSLPGEAWIITRRAKDRVVARPHRDDGHHRRRFIPRRKKNGKISVVFIDAGHGGRDPGAVGFGGVRESKIVLEVAKRVAARLRKFKTGVRVVLVRKFNRTLSLSQRAKLANKYIKKGHKGIFVSIHANASFSRLRRGFETYYLSPIASNAEARSTAAIENGALDLDVRKKQKNDMSNILSKMLVEEYRRESSKLARAIQHGLRRYIGKYSKDRKIKKANFFVMRRIFMPSVLVEVGFVTNKKEARLLSSASYQSKVATGISTGIRNFLHFFNKKN